RLALADIAGLVLGRERNCDLGARPRIVGQIARRLRSAGTRAQLRQRQRKFRRTVERMLAGGVGVLEREDGLALDDAVVVVDLVVELERAARLPLRIPGERDGRGAVGDDLEGPGLLAAEHPMHGGGAITLDNEAVLLGAGRERRLVGVGHLVEAAFARDLEMDIAGGADDELAAGGYRDRR